MTSRGSNPFRTIGKGGLVDATDGRIGGAHHESIGRRKARLYEWDRAQALYLLLNRGRDRWIETT